MYFRLAAMATAIALAFPTSTLAQNADLAAAALTSQERANGRVHKQVKADLAHARGYFGQNAVVAVLDTGYQGNHIELKGGFATSKMFDATIGSTVAITDGHGHGTHVAGIVAGSTGTGASYGIAPDARILPIKVFSSSTWQAPSTALAAGLKVATEHPKVSIINMSLGGGSTLGGSFETALRNAVNADKLVVAAAGNNGGSHPLWPARYAKETWAKGQIIAVGAVDANNVIASFSNRAGDTARWFIVAPGTNVLSSCTGGGYCYMSGTSMAAPVVAGAAALLEGAWPQLKAADVAAILFQTATDLGAPGVDAVYGWGLLNVDRAMQPVGTLGVNVLGGTLSASTAAMSSSTASWSGLRAAAVAGSFKGIAVDAFNRDFAADYGTAIDAPARERMSDALDAAGRPLMVMQHVGQDGSRFLAAVETPKPLPFGAEQTDGRRTLLASSAVFKLAGGKEMAFATGSLAGSYFGLTETEPALANPYLGLARSASQLAAGYTVGRMQFKGGVLDSGLNQAMTNVPARDMVKGGKAAVAEVAFAATEQGLVGLQFARVAEGESYLGTLAGRAMALDAGETSTTTMYGAYRLREDLTLAAQYAIGRTADASGAGLFTAARGVRSEAFALGLIANDRLARGDRLALTVSSPLRIVSGTAQVTMPVAITPDGDAVFERRDVSLASTSRELKLGLDYALPLSHSASVSFTGALKNNANHVEGEREGLVGVVYRKAF